MTISLFRPLTLAFLFVATPVAAQPALMERLWPNDDGRSWIYDQHYEAYGFSGVVIDNQVRVWFEGATVAPDGIEAQYLKQELVSGPAVAMGSPHTALASSIPDPLLRAVWIARPDLRSQIEATADQAPCPEIRPPGAYALLLGGEFAWRRTADETAAWRCNFPNTRSWRWLVADLTVGNTFTLQLLPDLADDILLHATVAAIEPSGVPAGTFSNCVRVDYVVDYGTLDCVDPSGNVTGTYRSETRGYVRYAPDVGPVESFEQWFPVVESTNGCNGIPIGQPHTLTTMRLNSLPVPARLSSWGRIKAAYR
jgi:hypothetical protein